MKSLISQSIALSLFFLVMTCYHCFAMKMDNRCNSDSELICPKLLCVTSGSAYTDIDALACAVALAELHNCSAVLPGTFNSTIPHSVRKWDFKFSREFSEKYISFIIVDVSNPTYFPHHIKREQIVEVFDHHFGFQNYWGNTGKIEPVGACATLIFELFKDKTPSATTANLLYTAIIANTLNFKASVTTPRDIAAFEKLKDFISLPENWVEKYYSEVENKVLEDLETSIKNDTKILGNGWAVAQIELYNPSTLFGSSKFLDSLWNSMKEHSHWLLTLPSISEGKNYFVTNSWDIQKVLSEKVQSNWLGLRGVSDKLYLRKEILKITNLK